MKLKLIVLCVLVLMAAFSILNAQTASSAQEPQAVVPRLVNFAGHATDANGKILSGAAGMTFAIYREQQGGAPLWVETQNVAADGKGNFTVQLGATKPEGLPLELFTSGEARWLGVAVNGGAEQARGLLMSVPYALKAADAQTLGGLPASAFVLAAPPIGAAPSVNGDSPSASPLVPPPPASAVTTNGGTANTLPLFSTGTDIENSAVTQTGSGTTAKIGIGTAAPASTLDVKGSATVRGTLSLQATGTATASTGKNSQPAKFAASSFNSTTSTAVPQTFQWQAEPAGNNTPAATGTINLLFGQGTATPAETGLKIGSNGQITFATGQTFPGTGNGTITGVTAGTGLTGGGKTGAVTLNVDATKVPLLAASNVFTGNQAVNGNVSATGVVSGSAYQIGSALFAFGSTTTGNAFTGFAGNTTMTGTGNTANGNSALASNTTGGQNTASGVYALTANTTGGGNTAVGESALFANTTGSYNNAVGLDALAATTSSSGNTATGAFALYSDTSGNENTAVGHKALLLNTTGSSNSALGASALYSNTTASNNTAVGYSALYSNTTGPANTANGYEALFSNSTGAQNVASGYQALYSNTTGSGNNAYGGSALFSNTTGTANNAMGHAALYYNTTGNQNTAIGDIALIGLSTGSGNTALGAAAGGATTGYNNTALGYSSGQTGGDLYNTTAVGAFAQVSQSNSVVLGSIANSSTGTPQAYVGIGTSAPSYILTIGQGLGAAVADGWAVYSSRRWKTNIKTLPDALAKVQKLRGVSYDLKANGKHEIGVIAEEVGAVVPEIVNWEENGKDARSVDYSRLTALLIEATKQQQSMIRTQQRQIRAQQKDIRTQQAEATAQEGQISQLAGEVKTIQTALQDQSKAGAAVVAASHSSQGH